MVTRAEDYVWSSARAHCGLEGNRLLTAGWPDCSLVTNWSAWLEETPDVSREHRTPYPGAHVYGASLRE
jgi:hypothetical protein